VQSARMDVGGLELDTERVVVPRIRCTRSSIPTFFPLFFFFFFLRYCVCTCCCLRMSDLPLVRVYPINFCSMSLLVGHGG